MIRIGMFEAYLERMLIRGIRAAYISYFTRTLQEAKAIASTMCTTEQNTIWLNKNGQEKRYNVFGSYKAYYVPIMRGKERFYHGVILNAAIGNDLFVSKEETAGEELYEILMKKYPLPLLKWWGKPILSYALREGLINAYSNRLHTECVETEYSLQGTDDLKEMQIYDLVTFDYEALKSAIQVLFEQKQIADRNAVAFLHQFVLIDGFREFAENVLVEFLAQAFFHGIADLVCLLLFDLGHEPGNVAAL